MNRLLLLLPAIFQVSIVLPAIAQMSARESLTRLEAPKGFTISLWAEEPMVVNPTAIDVDSRGRVWIAEGLNYRFFRNNEFRKAPGCDRIKIIEDTDGDGKADKVTVFAENIYPVPMGLAIQERWVNGVYKGCRVFTGNSPELLVLEDTDGDDVGDKRSALLTGFGGYDHDHGVHGMMIGPDGKLYFTQGNGGLDKRAADLKPGTTFDVTDKSNRRLSMAEQGTTFRCDLDGRNLEVLAWRFRNNYECWANSFGQVFVSDNDDDGNRGVRMVWLMEGGDYGYQNPRSKRHWAEELPGIVPKIAGTGNGSPCGILVYEGREFPSEYVGNVFQVDAGTRQINYFPLKRHGAAFRTEHQVFLKGSDPNFRPVDVAVAPDGSMLVADWYDAGVGGHRFTDQTTGRIFRVTPPGSKSKSTGSVKSDFATTRGQIAALLSSNAATRIVAAQSLADAVQCRSALQDVMQHGLPYERARALYVLSKMPKTAMTDIDVALNDSDPRIREQAVRIMGSDCSSQGIVAPTATIERELSNDVRSRLLARLDDPDASVRRELLLSVRNERVSTKPGRDRQISMAPIDIAKLAAAWDGEDRFYLEALRLCLFRREPSVLKVVFLHLMDQVRKDAPTQAAAALPPFFPTATNDAFLHTTDRSAPSTSGSKLLGIAWALQNPVALPYLEELATSGNFLGVDLAVDAVIASLPQPKAGEALVRRFLAINDVNRRRSLLEILQDRVAGTWMAIKSTNEFDQVIDVALQDPNLRLAGMRLIGAGRLRSRLDSVLQAISDSHADAAIRGAALEVAKQIAPKDAEKKAVELLHGSIAEGSEPLVLAALSALATSKSPETQATMAAIVGDDTRSAAVRTKAVRSLGSTKSGAERLIALFRKGKIADSLKGELQFVLHNHSEQAIRDLASRELPMPKTPVGRTLAQLTKLVNKQNGSIKQGVRLFNRDVADACIRCHRVEGIGHWVGPDLSSIGVKYGKAELLFHIVNPSAAIGYNLDSYIVTCSDGRIVTGLIIEDTSDRIVLKTALNERIAIPVSQIDAKRKSEKSLMPDGLIDTFTDKNIVDLIEYLSSLRRESQTVGEFSVSGPAPRSSGAQSTPNGLATSRPLTTGRDGFVDLTSLFGGQANKEAILRFSITLTESQKARLVITGNAQIEVLVAGRPIRLEGPIQGVGEPARIAETTLPRGTTPIAVRVQSGKPGGLSVTVVTDRAVQLSK